jgi:Flp pilus assembly protein protease CpaA
MATTALLVWALMVAIGDAATRRIPNLLLLAALIPGVAAFSIRDRGWLDQTLVASFVGLLIPLLLLLPGFLLRALGGGDVKFAACCGWFVGPRGSLVMLLGMALVLGAIAAWVGWRTRATPGSRPQFPAGPAIAAGFLGALVAPALQA